MELGQHPTDPEEAMINDLIWTQTDTNYLAECIAEVEGREPSEEDYAKAEQIVKERQK